MNWTTRLELSRLKNFKQGVFAVVDNRSIDPMLSTYCLRDGISPDPFYTVKDRTMSRDTLLSYISTELHFEVAWWSFDEK